MATAIATQEHFLESETGAHSLLHDKLPGTSTIEYDFQTIEAEPTTYERSREVDGDIFLYYQGVVRNMQLQEGGERESLLKPNIDYTYATKFSDGPTKYDREKMWEIYTGKRLITSQVTIPGRAFRRMEGPGENDASYDAGGSDDIRLNNKAVQGDSVRKNGEQPVVNFENELDQTDVKESVCSEEHDPANDDDKTLPKAVCFSDGDLPIDDDDEKNDDDVNAPSTNRKKRPKPKLERLRPVSFIMPDDPGFPTTPKGNTLPPLKRDGSDKDRSRNDNDSNRHARPRLRYNRPDYTSSFPLFEYERKQNKVNIYSKGHDYSHIKSKIDTNLTPKRRPRNMDEPEKDRLFTKRTHLDPLNPGRLPHISDYGRTDRQLPRYDRPEYGRSQSLDPGLIRHNNFQIPKYPTPHYNIKRDRKPYWNNMYYPRGAPPVRRRRNKSCPPRITRDQALTSHTTHRRQGAPDYVTRVPIHWTY